MLSREVKNKLEAFETPFYFYDMGLLDRTLKSVTEESAKYGYTVHYAIKANFDDRILEAIRKYGLGVDCVSGNEVRKAIECGFDAKSIVFAGVGKSDKEIRYSIEQDIFVFNCESREELEAINAIAGEMGETVNIALRINPDVDPMTHQYISTGQADNKFGISYKEVEEVADEIENLRNVNIVGLHFHIGSQVGELRVFEYLCKRVNTLCKWFTDRGFKLDHVNMGGGLAINYDNPDAEPVVDFASYFRIFADHLEVPAGMGVHFELGRSIVGQCGELISRVLYNKVTAGGKNVVIIDASMTELIRPALYHAHHAIENLTPKDATKVYTVAGPVCESSDVFERDVELPLMERGDLISIKSAGAYGISMASRYNLHDLPAAVYSDEL